MANGFLPEQIPARAYLTVVVKRHNCRNQMSTARVEHRRTDHREQVVRVNDIRPEASEHPTDFARGARAPYDLTGYKGLLTPREAFDVVAHAFEMLHFVTGGL
jgi:hypothetical protein